MKDETLPSMARFVSLVDGMPTLDDLRNMVSTMDATATVYQGSEFSALADASARQLADILRFGR